MFSSGEVSILWLGEHSLALNLCPILLVSASLLVILGFLPQSVPLAEQRGSFAFCLWHRFSLYLHAHTITHTFTITNTPQHTHTYNLSPSHTHHITHKIIYAIIHTPRRLIECHYNNQNEIRFLTSLEARHIPETLHTLPDDCGLSWVSSLSCQFSGPLLLELSCKLRVISSWLGTKDAGK